MDTNVRHGFGLFVLLVLAAGGLLLSGCPAEETPPDPASPQTPGDEYFVFVDAVNGNDGAAGTKSDAVDDINEGIALAELAGKDVCVAEGSYEVNYSSANHIVMVEGVSIYGGYRNTGGTWTRNISSYTTTITDVSIATGVANQAIACGGGITTDTVIDGFRVNGGGGTHSAAVCIDSGSPTVTHNTLNGGSGTTWSYSVYVGNGGAPELMYNVINGGSGGASAGIMTGGSDTYVAYNSISGGNSSSMSNGVCVSNDGHPEIAHNTIDTGTAAHANGIILASDSHASISANKLWASGGTVRTGIFEATSSSVPEAVIDNIFSSTLLDTAEGTLYIDLNGGGGIIDIASVNALDENGYNPTGTVYGNTYLSE